MGRGRALDRIKKDSRAPRNGELHGQGRGLRLRFGGNSGRRVAGGRHRRANFSLDLVLQAVDRTAACDEVWLAVGPAGRKRLRDPRVRKLCRFLGFGLLGVSSAGEVEVLVEPKPWKPRKDKRRRTRLIDEHRKRIGDPAKGGSTRQPIMTAYRQQALACAASLAGGPRRTSELRSVVPRSARSPITIPARGWKDILWRTYTQIGDDRLLVVAAGAVFYLLLALVPAITALVKGDRLLARDRGVHLHGDEDEGQAKIARPKRGRCLRTYSKRHAINESPNLVM
jgi:hypothetical protein